jgi:hypothetical protein
MSTVLVVLLMGALAIGLARLIIKPEPGVRTALFGVVTILLLIVGQYIGYRFVRPHVQAAIAAHSLGDQPLFRTLRKYEPALYDRLERGYQAAIRSGTEQKFLQTAIVDASELTEKYLPVASNESVRNLMRHTLEQLEKLQRKPDDTCFRLLFPHVAGSPELDVLPKSVLEENMRRLEAVLLSAIERPQAIPAEQDVLAVLQPIYLHLSQSHGEDLQMLADPGAAGVDRRKVCSMTVELYDRILALPDDQDAMVLRFMITKTAG